jgi:hypothetical protein
LGVNLSSTTLIPESSTYIVLGRFANLFSLSHRIAYMINENSVQFNIVSKHLGCERMAFFLNEAAGDIRDMMSATMPAEKAKL